MELKEYLAKLDGFCSTKMNSRSIEEQLLVMAEERKFRAKFHNARPNPRVKRTGARMAKKSTSA